MNTFELGLAVLSSAAYRVGRDDNNFTPSFPGAVRLSGDFGYESRPDSGFGAVTFHLAAQSGPLPVLDVMAQAVSEKFHGGK
jgi:hypothetical protein